MSDDQTTFDASFATRLARESWAWYGVGCLLLVLRIIAKIRFSIVRYFTVDDAAALLAFLCYTGTVVSLNYISSSGGSNLIDPSSVDQVPAAEISAIILNSKVVVVSEQAYLNTLYACKVCVLLFFGRVTSNLPSQKSVKAVGAAVLLAYIATQIAFFSACRPFNQYWALFPTNSECTTLKIYGIVQQSANIPTDIAMLAITLPIVYKLQLGIRQKILIGGLFSMGIFVVLMAVLNVAFTNTDYYSSSYMLWYVRENSVAFFVAMLPHIWPLLMAVFPTLARTVNYSRNFYANSKSRKQGSNGATTNMAGPLGTNASASHRMATVATSAGQTQVKGDSMEELEKMYGVKVVSEVKVETSQAATRPTLQV